VSLAGLARLVAVARSSRAQALSSPAAPSMWGDALNGFVVFVCEAVRRIPWSRHRCGAMQMTLRAFSAFVPGRVDADL